ncbi:MAG: hypothetical protein MZU91_11525 [Desulfosudis oleivorans]|nr:hypothetical protein [Desulfosudis oleivorans]
MPDGEALARQLLYGKRYFLDKFGVDVKVGWNPDTFGHSWQLPQILRRAGIDSYVFGRCAPGPDPTHFFWWEGMDGSRVLGYVPAGWYNVSLQNGTRRILEAARKNTGIKDFLILYGAGDHGGGPRDVDLAAIRKFGDGPERAPARLRSPRGLSQGHRRDARRRGSPSSSASSISPSRPATRPRRRPRRTTASSRACSSRPRSSPRSPRPPATGTTTRSATSTRPGRSSSATSSTTSSTARASAPSTTRWPGSTGRRGRGASGRSTSRSRRSPTRSTRAARASRSSSTTLSSGSGRSPRSPTSSSRRTPKTAKPWAGTLRLTDGDGKDVPVQVVEKRAQGDNTAFRIVFTGRGRALARLQALSRHPGGDGGSRRGRHQGRGERARERLPQGPPRSEDRLDREPLRQGGPARGPGRPRERPRGDRRRAQGDVGLGARP